MMVGEREREACRFIDTLPRDWDAVIIGGYAVNAWTRPRYSEDVDIVVPEQVEAEVLDSFAPPQWVRVSEWTDEVNLAGRAFRFVQNVTEEVDVTVDLLFGSVVDRTFQVPIPHHTIRERSVETVIPCVETSTQRAASVADPATLCLLKCQPLRSTDKDDIVGLLLVRTWERRELHELSRRLLPAGPLAANLRRLSEFVGDDRTLRLGRRRFPQLGREELTRRREMVKKDVQEWLDAVGR